ncbi:phosphatase PAP2 family protein [uncultured Duncaniella sp.]|uniref:phosphatase PAP2 family protein n=1 Tax=uncultured Duncaniella sp. TaxID=2768039 RepID=UPI002674BE0D|nr:phosphatase PAP2 family protein [uncultured Duncaniella sp.]MCI9172505.1 hypothetical protein [Muribaculaceae bacterium]
MKRVSQILSYIFSPLLVPTYGMILASFLSVLSVLSARVLCTTVAITFVITCVIPACGIMAMYKTGFLTDPGVNVRTERSLPYALTILCYVGCCFFLYRAGAPSWLTMFYAGGGAAALINAVVNLKWKISAHAAAMGGLVAMLFRIAAMHQSVVDLNIWISAVVVLAGAVMTARVYLQRHTLMQVLAGCANGFLCVWLLTMFYIHS